MSFFAFARRYALPHWGWYLAGLVMLAGTNLVALEVPRRAKVIVDDLVATGGTDDMRGIALSIVCLGFLMLVIRALSRILIFWPGRRLETTVKSDLFARMMRLPETFYERFGMGDLISRIANDVGQLRVFFAFGVLQIANVIFLMTFTVASMASIHAELTAACLGPLVLMIIISRIAMPQMHKYSRENQDALGRLTTRVTEAFVNIHTIQANAAEEAFAQKAEVENEAVYSSNMKLVFVRTFLFPMMVMLTGLSQLVVLFYGGKEVMAGRLTAGDILAFNAYIGLLVFPLTALGMIIAVYQRGKTALERVEVIDRAEEEGPKSRGIPDAPSGLPLLAVRGLSFSHQEDGTGFRLQDVSFDLSKGKSLGLWGPIGSGKSTLFTVLTRLKDPPAGTVYLEGKDVLAFDPRELRRRIGYALQTVHLFSASIRENLTFGLEREVSKEELDEACRLAMVLDEVRSFEHGFETEIGEKGVRLSGGQKQRLALARLFLRRPEILLLDDVLSAVDHTTEQRLIANIFGQGYTMIIASHRPSALKRCDEVLMLDQGRIVDRGTFAELERRHPELAEEPEEATAPS